MATVDAKVQKLGSLPLFAGCSRRELQRLAALCDAADVPAGLMLCGEGRVGLEFFVLVEGQAHVHRGGELVASVGPGGFFGELALLDRATPRRHASVVAATPLTLYVFDARSFAGMLHNMPEIAERLRDAADERRRDVRTVA
jgi:CRP-like cAMP-binding protein